VAAGLVDLMAAELVDWVTPEDLAEETLDLVAVDSWALASEIQVVQKTSVEHAKVRQVLVVGL
jgi:hypothetical protein